MRLGIDRRYRRSLIVLPLLLSVLFFMLHCLFKRAEPIFVAQASNYANTVFTDFVNQSISEISQSEEFEKLHDVYTNGSGNIEAVNTNTAAINKIKAELLIDIQNRLNNDYPAKIKIPLGSATGYYLLYSAGPTITLSITPVSIVNSEFEESFDSVGINQVRHSISMKISVDMMYSGYMMHETETIITTVPIIETLIVGEVPKYYGGKPLSDGN